MRANVARRSVTHAGCDVIKSGAAAGRFEFDLRAYAVAVTLHADQSYRQPVVLALRFIEKQFRRLIQRSGDYVNASVVVEIGERASTVGAFDLKARVQREKQAGASA